MKLPKIILCLTSCFAIAQKDNFQAMKRNATQDVQDPQHIVFSKDEILIDKKKCFSYRLQYDVQIDGRMAQNYYEIKDQQGKIIFSGNITDQNPKGQFVDTITFHLLGKKLYRNKNITGRNQLILNLAANHVINSDCTVDMKNLQLFYDKSNEYYLP